MSQSPSPLHKTYDEALSLVVEARNYLAYSRSMRPGASAASLRQSCEAMRMTARLTQVMAWLMAQRAVETGELSLEEACGEQYRLSAADICLDETHDDPDLPEGLRSLMDRSFRLYQRIARLEDMILSRQNS